MAGVPGRARPQVLLVGTRIVSAVVVVTFGTWAILKRAGWLQPGHCDPIWDPEHAEFFGYALTNPTWLWDGFHPRFWCTLLGTAAVAAAGCCFWAERGGRPAEARAWMSGSRALSIVALVLVPGFLLWWVGPERAKWMSLLGSRWDAGEEARLRTEFLWRAGWAASAAAAGFAAAFAAGRLSRRVPSSA